MYIHPYHNQQTAYPLIPYPLPQHTPVPAYHPVYGPYHPSPRPYPPVDIKLFEQSVKSFPLLIAQGNLLLKKLADKTFAKKIMDSAQKGDQATVNSLLKSIGMSTQVDTHYTPSTVTFVLIPLQSQASSNDCCSLSLTLKWGQ